MTIIPNETEKDNAIIKCCTKFIKRFHVNQLLRKANAKKEKGIPAYEIFAFLLGLVFSGKNLYTLLSVSKEKAAFGKDAVYRFLNKANINWAIFLFYLSCSVITEVDRLTSDNRRTAWVIDDTAYYRDRSKKCELLSRFKDHSNNRYYKGYTLLTIGWTDGQTFIPFEYRLVANSDGKKLVEGSHVEEDNRTLATKIRRDAMTEKPKLVLNFLERAKNAPIGQPKYVVFDSWFCSPSSILSIKGIGYDVVARMKNHKNFLYRYEGELLPLNKIFAQKPKRRGKSRYLLSVTVDVCHKDFEESVPAKIVYIRDRNKRNKWIALISTDVTLDEEEIVALYGKRWDIEPFHRVIKSLLGLEKEFQSRSFDGIVAHTAIVMARYILLSLENRENKDLRSVNEGFFYLCDELEDISFAHAFELIMSIIAECSAEYLCLTKQQVDAFISHFMSSLPCYIKEKLRFAV